MPDLAFSSSSGIPFVSTYVRMDRVVLQPRKGQNFHSKAAADEEKVEEETKFFSLFLEPELRLIPFSQTELYVL